VLRWAPAGELAVDRVVALPQLEGPRLAGLLHDAEGFLPTDLHGRVRGVLDVYAAGDVTAFPVKQGGLAAEQADAVAESIAAWAGVALTPTPFRPVLRGKILTGGVPLYVRTEPAGGRGDVSDVSPRPLWWPPTKVAGRFLAPALGGAGLDPVSSLPSGAAPLAIQVDLEETLTPAPGADSP
jgi:sulfide:quinone oxidoreductase